MSTTSPDFSDHYSKIGQALVDALPGDFQAAWAKMGIPGDNVWSLEVFYLKPNNRYGYMDHETDPVFNALIALWKAYKEAGLEAWTTATFYLTNTGKMTLVLGYEDISDFDLDAQRREAWIKKYLGDASLIDWPPPPILTTMLNSHYSKIRQALVDLLPGDFQAAWARMEVPAVAVWGLDVFYLKMNDRYGCIVDETDPVFDALIALWKYHKEAGLKAWTTVTFYLTNTGEMTLDRGYEDVSDFDLDVQRREAWIKKYLGDASLIDWPPPPT